MLFFLLSYNFNTFKFLQDTWTVEIRRNFAQEETNFEPELLSLRIKEINSSILIADLLINQEDENPKKQFYASFSDPNTFKVSETENFNGPIASIKFVERNQSLLASGIYDTDKFFKLILLASPKISLEIINNKTRDYLFIMFYRLPHKQSWFSSHSSALLFPLLFFSTQFLSSKLIQKIRSRNKPKPNENQDQSKDHSEDNSKDHNDDNNDNNENNNNDNNSDNSKVHGKDE